ncbi:hypothetical protein [Sphingomonas bacterium]|uniref:hypothetical protein n=1 Tax=Sphingomonas bacterium TaxID=1895847 RepID=UPI0015775C8B|nr:hypothetical protein [Sphingomonas bacterium]
MKTVIATLALLATGPALAQATPAAKPSPKPTATAHVVARSTTTTTKTTGANMAVHTTKTGKKITYDCSKPGNANKTACKKK